MVRKKITKNLSNMQIVKVNNDDADKVEEQRKVGRPKKEFGAMMLQQVELLGKLGATNEQIAVFFGVNILQISRWQNMSPEFAEARKRGGMEADMKVAESLYKRATGFYYEEEEMKYVDREWRTFTVRKYCIPDNTSAIFWLKNRQSAQWNQASKVQHEGSIEHKHTIENVPVEDLSEEAQKLMFEISRAQLVEGKRDN